MNVRVGAIVLAGCLVLTAALGWHLLKQDGPEVVVYKSPTCGCCVKWARILEDAGFAVRARDMVNMGAIKAEYGVTREIYSCHTAIVEGRYVIEGHVPVEQIQRLLQEQPDITGLAVPAMPIGSPGMEGPNPVQYDVLAFDSSGTTVYATVNP